MINEIARIYSTNYICIGDWIYLKENSGVIHKGYVTEILAKDVFKFYNIGFYKKNNEFVEAGGIIKASTVSYNYSIYKNIEELTIKDIGDKSHLIDLALDTEDEKWFRELVN